MGRRMAGRPARPFGVGRRGAPSEGGRLASLGALQVIQLAAQLVNFLLLQQELRLQRLQALVALLTTGTRTRGWFLHGSGSLGTGQLHG
jgi:hypothetical protein